MTHQPVATSPPTSLTWGEWVADHPEDADWASQRWLADPPRLGVPPADLATTRDSLHTLVTNVMTPARYRSNGKIALRWTLGGFGTPFFGDDEQVRVEGHTLVVQRGSRVDAEPLSTVADACRLVLGQPRPDMQWVEDLDLHDEPATASPGTSFEVDEDAARYLGNWFGLAYAVLERLRADEESVEASRPQLWPEHFDPAIEVLPDQQRASYGFSPGDGGVPEPYVYVSIWYPDDVDTERDEWNSDSFGGAVLTVSEIAEEDDQVGYVLDWLRTRRDLLAADS